MPTSASYGQPTWQTSPLQLPTIGATSFENEAGAAEVSQSESLGCVGARFSTGAAASQSIGVGGGTLNVSPPLPPLPPAAVGIAAL